MAKLQLQTEVTRDAVWLRHLTMGPTGAGKSKGALQLAFALSKFYGGLPVALVNSEPGRGKLYADRYKLDGYIGLDEEGDFAPERYVEALDIFNQAFPGGIYVVDSASHEWMGINGVLRQADKFADWKLVRPKHNAFIERIQYLQAHVICTVRAKMKYDVSETDDTRPGRSGKRQQVTALGLGPVQSDDFQYEFNLVGRFDLETHEVTFSGHVDPLVDQTFNLETDAEKVAGLLGTWLSTGTPIAPVEIASEESVLELIACLSAEGKYTPAVIEEKLEIARRQNRGELHPEYVAKNIAAAKERLKLAGKAIPGEAAPAAQEAPDGAATPAAAPQPAEPEPAPAAA